LRTTAFPTRLEVIKPARDGAADSAPFKKPRVSISPRTERPSVRTLRNSESRVNRLDFGKRRRFCIAIISVPFRSSRAKVEGSRYVTFKASHLDPATAGLAITRPLYSKSLPRFSFEEDFAKQTADYGVDAGDDDVLIVVFVSVLFVVAGDGLTIVVLVSFFS
jgi:hypothetical protein